MYSFGVIAAVAKRPRLWRVALRQAFRLAEPGWWHRLPLLPIPPREYMAFRMVTQYGNAQAAMTPDDVVSYLQWCRDWDSRA